MARRLSSTPPRRPDTRASLLACVVLASATATWWGGTVGLPLHQDDFLLAAGPHGPWRIVFVGLVRLLWLAFGWHPLAYHIVVLAAHVAAAWLLFRLALRAGAPSSAALAAATVFATAPMHAYSLYNVASAADIVAAVPLLGAALAAVDGRRGRSVGLFLLALACKETVVLMPLAFPLLPGAARRRVPWLHLACAGAWLALLWATHGLVSQQFGHLYVRASAAEALRNLAGYASASADWMGRLVDPYRNVPHVSLPLLAGLAALLGFGTSRRDLRVPTALAAAWFVAAIAPVTTTSSMFVLYYLYVPLVGLALFAAALAGALRVPVAVTTGVAAFFLGASAYGLARVEGARLPGTDVHAQSSLRHARVAGHVLGDVGGAPLGRYVALAPPLRYRATARANRAWYDRNVVVAISDGRALSLASPGVEAIEPARPGEPYAGWTRVMLAWDGHVRALVPPRGE